MMTVLQLHPATLWRQVWGLAAMLAALLVSLIIYQSHQSDILNNLGFSQFAAFLGVLQGVLGAVLEPLVGGFSDRIKRHFGSRLPQITAGITLAGLLFVLLAILLPINLPISLRWVFPVLMSIWLAAMITIRGPIVALLRQLAPTDQLPIANSILILVLGLVGALNPLLNEALNYVGASISFMLGAIVLVIGGAMLYTTLPHHRLGDIAAPTSASLPQPKTRWILMLMALVGMGTAIQVDLLLTVFIPHLQPAFPSLRSALLTSIVLLIAALTANPLGWLTSRWGAIRAMQVGLGSILLLMAIALLPIQGFLAAILLLGFGVAFGLVFISMVPFALSYVPPEQTGLSAGLFFGGNSAGITLFYLLHLQPNLGNILFDFWIAAIAWGATIYWLHRCQVQVDRNRNLVGD